ncbi:MAG: endopeptidase La [Mycoplasmataceae bacterium]|nr:endopeptidase La [Mycoplasmataceae bacterium]
MKYNAIISRELIALPSSENTPKVGRPKSVEVVKKYLDNSKDNKKFVLLTQDNPDIENPKFKDIFQTCTLCEIISTKLVNKENKGEVYEIKFKCLKRQVLLNLSIEDNYVAEVETFKDLNGNDPKLPEIITKISELLKKLATNKLDEKELQTYLSSKSSSDVLDKIALNLSRNDYSKYKSFRREILEEKDLVKRAEIIYNFLLNKQNESESEEFKAQVDSEINKKVNEKMSAQQREFYLREKMKAVKDELGKINPNESDVNSYRKRVEENPYPNYIKEKVLAEINKMESTGFSQENAITKQYIEWLLNIPWWQETEDDNSVKHAKEVLDKSHFGLEKVKERIIEYLAVRARAPKGKSPIICLSGPPGVGKTSLAKSIAEALNKKFVKMSLGGVKDESEIRGHRKTYLGSMPGRIISGMKNAGVVNPLFLLDEIDKMGNDGYKGDPSSALLEVLDPEQNKLFSDNYIEEPYDLSKVMFVCTANYISQIPEPLYDRLEIIELTSYTEYEKLSIAKNYLINRTLSNTGLNAEHFSITDEMILFIIRHYTREAGVRELERVMQKIARKIAVKLQEDENFIEKIDSEEKVKLYLGKIVFEYNMKDEKVFPGVVNGMAYTSAGGDLLPIEVTSFKGKAGISITGNLKETMKESVQVALGYVKSNAEEFGLGNIDFSTIDLHIHVPSGGVPKDGPSAGVTLTTAIISALSKKKVPNNIAMTGEITLRGKVGIIGGVREKVISAYRGGVTEFFIPKDDERYLEDIPKEIRDNVVIHLVETYDEIFQALFAK